VTVRSIGSAEARSLLAFWRLLPEAEPSFFGLSLLGVVVEGHGGPSFRENPTRGGQGKALCAKRVEPPSEPPSDAEPPSAGLRERESMPRYDLDVAKAVLSHDTAPEAEHLQVEIWRAMSPLQKAQLTSAVTRGASDLALAGIRSRHPDASPRELEIRMARMTLGADLARRVYSDATELLGP